MDDVEKKNKEIALAIWGSGLGRRAAPGSPEAREHFDTYYTQDYWNHASVPGKDRGFENTVFVGSAFKELFTQPRFEIEMVAAEGDLVFLHGEFSAIHSGGTLYGIPATGVAVSQPQVHILRFKDFKISDHYVVRDDYIMYRQVAPDVTPEGGIMRNVDTDKYEVPHDE
jgi:predicted ester cyclase